MGINLARQKMLSFCVSSFFSGVGGALLAMYSNQVQAKLHTSALSYELLLIVVIGGIGSVSGSCLASFLYIAASEWWLRGLDDESLRHRAHCHKRAGLLPHRPAHGGVLGGHHGGGPLLPQGHHGG